MKNGLLICLFLILSVAGYSQCTLNVVLSQPSVAVCAGNVVTLTANGGDSYTWYNAASGGNVVGSGQTYTTPVLTSSTTYYVVVGAGNCNSSPLPVTVNVTPFPQAPTAAGTTICSGSTVNLHADGASSVFNWYAVPVGGTPLISSPDYTTPALTATTIYYVETLANGCESQRTPVTVTVDPIPDAPTAQSDTICYGSSTVLAVPGNAPGYQWYDAVADGNLLSTTSGFTTPALNNSTTYYVQAVNGGCVSTRTPINVIVRPQLSAPSVSGAIVCPGSVTVLTAASQGGTYQWYDAPSGGNLLATGATYTTPALSTTTSYYVQNTVGNCVSPRAMATVSITIPPAAPTASNVAICYGTSADLTASDTTNIYLWYDAPTGGNLLATYQTYETPPLTSSTTYYAETMDNGCISARTPVTVSVNPIPTPPTVSGTSVCSGMGTSLTATASGTVSWYDASTGGTLLATGNTFTTPALLQNTTYYVENTTGTCVSSRTPVTVSVTALNNPQFQYPSGTFCTSEANPTPVINNLAGGTFSATPVGLVFVDNTTGQINIAASTPGEYTISFANNGACPSVTTEDIAIVTVANAQFSYNPPYCQDGVNPLPIFSTNATAGNFTATPVGLVFINPSTGEINLSASAPGTYTVTNTITLTGGCPSDMATNTVTIYQSVTVNAGPNQTINAGSTAQLAGSISGGITTGTWSGGTGSFSDPTLLNAVYTPGPGETTATLTLTSDDPTGPCGPKSNTVVINIVSIPPSPTVPYIATCYESYATLSATAPGGVYQWFDAATGGNLLATGPSFTTPALTANTTYYVQTTLNGITSSRVAATVVVNATPVAPIAQNTQACAGTTTTLSASGSPGTYQWYDSDIGGNLLSTSNTYTTPILTANVIYFVQSVVNGCISFRTPVAVIVTPVPNITSAATQNICSSNPINYTITTDVPGATFSWSRAQISGISNQAVINQTSSVINETLINTSATAINVTYVITAFNGACPGPSFNYVVTVYPTPTVISPGTDTICNFGAVNYTIQLNTSNTYLAWGRDPVAGISNGAVYGQTSGTIKEVLYNTTNAPVNVTYVIHTQTNTCTGEPFNLVVTINPNPMVTSADTGSICTGVAQNYTITSNVQSATFLWSRAAVSNISNPAVSNQTTATINETLINTGPTPILVVYNITPIAYGCTGTPFQYGVIVYPQLIIPSAASNSPVCVASPIQLTTNTVANASYLWTGPNGFTSSAQNPLINNVTAANAGTYNLTLIVNGCNSPAASTTVVVDPPPVATAGPDQLVCASAPSVLLAGNITGGTATGIWATAGSGTFSPSNTALNAQYIPSDADRAAGAVTLTLSSASTDNCQISSSQMNIKFGPTPAVDAGPDQTLCAQVNSVSLNGKILIAGGGMWSTSGAGTFSPSATQLDASYIPGAGDAKKENITLTLTATGANSCYIATGDLTLHLSPPPVVNAGGTKYILKGNTITLDPAVNEGNVTYLWSPDVDISDVTVKDPVITGDINRVYTLTVTDTLGCVTSSSVSVKIAPQLKIDNAFTPNGDGINDVWNIIGLDAYTQATVDIFTRYGTKVYHSIGYDKPFDGTINGQALPVGVYYYIIDTKFNNQVFSGSLTLIR